MRTRAKQKVPRAKQVGYNEIVAVLRQQILDGKLPAGQQLPTHVELERQFHSTPPTVSRALALLQQHGFIRTEKRRGMFVAEHLPNRSHYALVMASSNIEQYLTQFYRALRNEAGRFADSGRRFSVFYEIAGHTDTEDYQRLVGLVQSHRLAGLIFAQSPYQLGGSPLWEEPGIPRVVVASKAEHPGVPAVYPDLDAFIPRALDYLAAHGRRRIALLRIAGGDPGPDEDIHDFIRLTTARGLVTRFCWAQSIHPLALRTANAAVQLLLFAPAGERPDAIIVRDDNLVEPVTAGLVAAGVRVPEDIEVVAHANFPWRTGGAVPVRHLGYDVRQLFQICVARIDALRRGEQPPALTLLPPLFEEELPKATATAQAMVSPGSIRSESQH